MTAVRCPVNEAATISRDEPALILEDRKITYSELEFYVAGAAARLRQAECLAGDRVALGVSEPWQAVVLLLALLRVKAVACLLAGDASDKENMALAGSRFRIGGPAPALDPEKLLPVYFEGQDTVDASRLLLEQPATILFHHDRGGTPRALLHTYGNHYYGARGANHAVRLSSRGRWLSVSPLHEAAGLSALFRCLLSGAARVLPAPGQPVGESLAKHGVTHAGLAPADLAALLEGGTSLRFPKLQALLVEGEAGPELLARARRGLPVVTGFGIPEVASGISVVLPDTPPARQNGAGMPMKYREVRIDPTGQLMVRGPALFAGYIEPSGVRRPTDAEGWFATGARGKLEEDGYLTMRPAE